MDHIDEAKLAGWISQLAAEDRLGHGFAQLFERAKKEFPAELISREAMRRAGDRSYIAMSLRENRGFETL